MQIHFVTVRCDHHSPHSGYDRFADFVPNKPFPLSEAFDSLPDAEKTTLFKKAKENVQWYEMPDLHSEFSVNGFKPLFRKHVFHFLYGENSFYHTSKGTGRKKVVATFHQPPEIHENYIRSREPLKNLDGIVVVGTNQIPYFSQYIDESRIFFVPHGVDTDFFTPPASSSERDPKRCLFVGKWLRDFDTLRNVSLILHRMDPAIRIDAVSKEYNRSLLENLPNLTFHSGIPEGDLLKKYQTASLLILPVNDCTANNSAIEGISCGTPVVTTDIGGIRDYLDDDCAVFCKPKDADEMANAVVTLLANECRRAEMEAHARQKAVAQFDWRVVSRTLVQSYKKLF